jgi:hypothetical protein
MIPSVISLTSRVTLNDASAIYVGLLILAAGVIWSGWLIFVSTNRQAVEAEVIDCRPCPPGSNYRIRVEFDWNGETRRLTLFLDDEFPKRIGERMVLHIDTKYPDKVAPDLGRQFILSVFVVVFGFLVLISGLGSSFT